MIEKIRKKLTIGYTLVIALILSACIIGSYFLYRQKGIGFVRESLNDYLQEEVWEASTQIRAGNLEPEIYDISFSISSPYNFSYWFLDKKLIHAQKPNEDEFAQILLRRLTEKEYQTGKIYYENFKYNKQKWYFWVAKQDLSIEGRPPAEIFVLFNYTPIRHSTKNYIKYAFWVIIATVLVSYLLGNWLVSRSMKYIEIMYQKQKQFVSDASHELRTPLSIMLSYAELLEYKPRDKKLISDIKEEILQLNRLIDNLLSIARYDNHKILLQRERFNLSLLAKETAASVEQTFCRPGEITVSGSKNVVFNGDKGLLRQLLYILLDNAVKYTSENKHITVQTSESKGGVKIVVSDNGRGIAPEDVEHIFERFYRADKSRNAEGLGLGLSLAELIVGLHGGTITVSSILNKGSEFTVILPQNLKGK